MQNFTPERAVKMVTEISKRYNCPIIVGVEDEPTLYASRIMNYIATAIAQEQKRAMIDIDFSKTLSLATVPVYMVMSSNNNVDGGVGISVKHGKNKGKGKMLELTREHMTDKVRISKDVICDTNMNLFGYHDTKHLVLETFRKQLNNAVMDPIKGTDTGKINGQNDDLYSSLKLAFFTDSMARDPNHTALARIPTGKIFDPRHRTQQRTIKMLQLEEEEKKSAPY